MGTKQQAWQKVAVSVRAGTLAPQPCEACGAAKAQAHHDDYQKPLDVRWLCQPCHRAHHAEHGTPDAEPGDWHVSLWIDRDQEAAVRALAKSKGLTINGLFKHLLVNALDAQPHA